jgi:hypothetical protein
MNSGFARRVNHDSTIDSICLSCFKPVARASDEIDLVVGEKIHVCEPVKMDNVRGRDLSPSQSHERCREMRSNEHRSTAL